MRSYRVFLIAVLTLAVASTLLAHGGHKHNFLGTVKAVEENRLIVDTKDDGEVTFTLTEKTQFLKGTKAATKADLAAGVRVSVTVQNDGTTATLVKMAAGR